MTQGAEYWTWHGRSDARVEKVWAREWRASPGLRRNSRRWQAAKQRFGDDDLARLRRGRRELHAGEEGLGRVMRTESWGPHRARGDGESGRAAGRGGAGAGGVEPRARDADVKQAKQISAGLRWLATSRVLTILALSASITWLRALTMASRETLAVKETPGYPRIVIALVEFHLRESQRWICRLAFRIAWIVTAPARRRLPTFCTGAPSIPRRTTL